MSIKRSDRVKYTWTSNRKPYGLIFIIGMVAGIFTYHIFESRIEGIWPKIPYLNKLPSH